MNDVMVWVDCEMTGLNIHSDALIEIAAIVTDKDLNILEEGIDLLIKTPPEAFEQMDDFVRAMHTESGLLDELATATLTMAEAEAQVLAMVKRHAPLPHKAPLAGNSVGTDRTFLARDMPELEDWLLYRNIDVSTLKELSRRWYPKAHYAAPEKHGNHRALADIQESIEELRYYREAIFVSEPGPTTAVATRIAQRYQGSLTGINFAAAEESQTYTSVDPLNVTD